MNLMRNKANIPRGITATYSGGWVITSAEYRDKTKYRFIKYRWLKKDEAIRRFVESFGTDEQKRELNP